MKLGRAQYDKIFKGKPFRKNLLKKRSRSSSKAGIGMGSRSGFGLGSRAGFIRPNRRIDDDEAVNIYANVIDEANNSAYSGGSAASFASFVPKKDQKVDEKVDDELKVSPDRRVSAKRKFKNNLNPTRRSTTFASACGGGTIFSPFIKLNENSSTMTTDNELF